MIKTVEPVFRNITIILKQTKYSENIGSAARAMRNMGFSDLVLVAPQNFDPETAKKTATHESEKIIDNIRIADTLEDAVKDYHYIIGTTARQGKQRKERIPPFEMAKKTIPVSQNNQVALLFGPEDRGLQNKDLLYCNCLVTIPTFGFSSINLSHSVMLLCYEIAKGVNQPQNAKIPRLANKNELAIMLDKLDKVITETGYINPENPGYYFSKFRIFLSDLQLKSRDVMLINGLLKKILNKLKLLYF